MPVETQTMAEYIEKLKDACEWLGISQGRAANYVRLLNEFAEGHRSGEHIMACYESRDIVELYALWRDRVDAFPGLKDELQGVCRGGRDLSDEERNGSNNGPRNDAFNYLVAGKLLASGVSVVSVNGIASENFTDQSNADVTFQWEDIYVNVECKRLQSEAQLPFRAKEARKQITRSGHCGIIALDCSALCRSAGYIFDNSDPVKAALGLSKWLETYIRPQVLRSLSSDILGFILSASIPARTYTGMIVSPSGKRYQRPDFVRSSLVIDNLTCEKPGILKRIHSMLYAQLQRRGTGNTEERLAQ